MRLFLYRDNHRYTVLQTGGDPAKLNTWAAGVPRLLKAVDNAVVRSNNDTL